MSERSFHAAAPTGIARAGLVSTRPAEAVERAASSRFFVVRGLAGFALSIDALAFPLSRRLREKLRRRTPATGADSGAPPAILKKGLLAYSAALVIIGAGVVSGIVPGRPSLSLATGAPARQLALVPPASKPSSGPPVVPAPASPVPTTGPAPPTTAAPHRVAPPTTQPPPAAGVATGAGVALPLPIQYLKNGSVDQGVDYSAPGGTPLYAMGPGVITQEGIGGFGGNAPVLQITGGPLAGKTVYYGHSGPDLVPVGAHVVEGQQISIVGYGIVGISSGPHLEIGFWPLGGMGAGRTMLNYLNSVVGHSTG